MRERHAWEASFAAVWLAGAVAACSEAQCPAGYRKENMTCYRLNDGGPNAEAGDGEVLPDDAGSDAKHEDAEESGEDAQRVTDGSATQTEAGAIQPPDAGATAACKAICGDNEVCRAATGGDVCECASGFSTCEGKCRNLMSDSANCGACGYACAQGIACRQGQCEQRIRELVLDAEVSCALYDSLDGNFPIKCWGHGGRGLFRDGTAEALTPRNVAGVPRARALALSSTYCVVVAGEDKVRCWGGEGASANAFLPDISLAGVTRVAGAGAEASDGWGSTLCALHGVGDVSCWGASPLNGSSEEKTSPQGAIRIENNAVFTQLDGGYVHTCAISADSRVGCWGAVGWTGSSDGTLGVPNGTFPMGATSSPGVFVQKEQGGDLTGVVKIAVASTSCAVTEAHELWCWGPNGGGWRTTPGILGVGDETNHEGAVKVVLEDVTDVALGWGAQACAIARGQVYCWGSTNFVGLGAGVVGDGSGGSAVIMPRAVPRLTDVVEIKAGMGHTCARRRNGDVLCWGQNGRGELGDGTKVQRFFPTPVTGLY